MNLSHALFSSADIDRGTRLLLKCLANDPATRRATSILDEGTGTGIIGLALAAAFPQARVVMRDRDTLAVAIAKANATRNSHLFLHKPSQTAPGNLHGIGDTETGHEEIQGGTNKVKILAALPEIRSGCLADGLEGGPYDLVVTNIPAKAGAPVLEAFFTSCGSGLIAQGGSLALVIVNPLAQDSEYWIQKAGLVVRVREKGTDHTVFIADTCPATAALDSGANLPGPVDTVSSKAAGPARIEPPMPCMGTDEPLDIPGHYRRATSDFSLEGRKFRADGFYGVPDFDTLSHASILAASILSPLLRGRLIRRCGIENPGVGHSALWLRSACGVSAFIVRARDVLALKAVRSNLMMAGSESDDILMLPAYLTDKTFPAHSLDLLLWHPDLVPGYDWSLDAWTAATGCVKTGGLFAAVSTPTEIARCLQSRVPGWKSLASRNKSGTAIAVFERSAPA